MEQLKANIKNLIEQTGGTWGIVLEDLDTQDTWTWCKDELFYAASVIKVPIMVTVYSLAEKGKLNLNDKYILTKNDIVGGSGVLQHMSAGTELSLYDLVTLMIIQSDNTATNVLIDLVGVSKIQDIMKECGMEKSTFYHKLMISSVDRAKFNQLTASDMANLLKKIVMGQTVSVHACEQMIEVMKKQQITECLPGKFPYQDSNIIGLIPEWQLAHKTGWIPGTRHDVGILYVGHRKMIISAFSKNVNDLKSKETLANLGKEVFKYLRNEQIRVY